MILDRYILWRLAATATWTTAALALLVLPPIVLAAVARLGGVSGATLLTYLPLQLVELFPYLVPVVCLTAVAQVYGTLNVRGEWLAIALARFSPIRAIAPALLAAVLLSAFCSVLLTEVFPALRYAQRLMIAHAGREAIVGLFPGQAEIRVGDFALIGTRRSGDTIFDVIVRIPDGLVHPATPSVHARSVTLAHQSGYLQLRFHDAWCGQQGRQMRSNELEVSLSIDQIVGQHGVSRDRSKYQTSREIRARLESGSMNTQSATEFAFELHRRWALGTSAIALVALGVVTGLRIRRNVTLAATGSAIGCSLAYFGATIRLMEAAAVSGRVDPALAAWFPNALAASAGAFLLWRQIHR